MKKIEYEEVQNTLKSKNMTLLTTKDDYKNTKTKLIFKDEYGYLYYNDYRNIIKCKRFVKFLKYNPYTIDNIKTYFEINNIKLELLDNEFKSIRNKLKCKCLLCGCISYIDIDNVIHKKTISCKNCGIKMRNIKQMLPCEEVETRIKKLNYIWLNKNEYPCKNIFIKDLEGYKYSTTVNTLSNARFKKCDKFNKHNIFTIDNIKRFIIINNLDIELLDTKFIDSNTKMKFKCKCGNEFYNNCATLNQFKAVKCNKCSKLLSNAKNTLSISEVENELKNNELTIIDGVFKNCRSKLKVKDKNGYMYKVSIDILRHKSFPLKFSIDNPYTIDNIKTYIDNNKLPCTFIKGKYIGYNDLTLTFKCLDCNNLFITSVASLTRYNKIRCDVCSKQQSKISYLVEKFLIEHNIDYKKEHRFKDCFDLIPLPFDYVIYNDNNDIILAIEVDGQQHFEIVDFSNGKLEKDVLDKNFEKIKYHDEIKNNYCNDKNIKLIRLPYWYFKNDKYRKILNKELLNL